MFKSKNLIPPLIKDTILIAIVFIWCGFLAVISVRVIALFSKFIGLDFGG